jgi:hypothetical protein
MADLYITPNGSGDKSGSSWANAAAFMSINSVAKKAGDGGTVFLAADKGVYNVKASVNIAQAGVTITGVNTDGTVGIATFNGTRAANWTDGAAEGGELFRIAKGANDVSFSNIAANNVGTAFRVSGDLSNLMITHVTADNVARFFQTYPSDKTASVDGLAITDVHVTGFSEGVIRLSSDTRNVLIQDVRGDSQGQDAADDFAVGVHLEGTTHDVVLRRVVMENAKSKGTSKDYWQGDGFATEGSTYNITFQDTVARGNTDGGYDLKSDNTTLIRALAEGNGRNYRFWGLDNVVKDSLGLDPHKIGGISTQSQIFVAKGATVTVENSVFKDSGASTKAIYNEGGAIRFIDSTLELASSATAFFGKMGGTPAASALEVVRTAATGGWSTGSFADLLGIFDVTPVAPIPAAPLPIAPPVVVETVTPAPIVPAPGPAAPVVVAPPVVVPTTPVAPDPAPEPVVVAPSVPVAPVTVAPTPAGISTHRVSGTAAAESLSGTAARDTFFFDVTAARTGVDTVRGFEANDVLVTRRALADKNGDGLITFSSSTLDLGDGASKVKLADLSKAGLRLLGETEDGFTYGDASVRLKGFKEGKLGSADTLSGGSKDTATDKFFFDTALGREMGADTVIKFGAKDVLVTTAALGTGATGSVVQATGGRFALGDGLGSVALSDMGAGAVTGLEFDGARVIDGVHYYVYSAVGSAVGVEVLG